MGELSFIVGGARSGKSAFALRLADGFGGRRVFLATAEARDEEMAARIERHRSQRPPHWRTVEEPLRLVERLSELRSQADVVLVDCLTLWLANRLLVEDNPAVEPILADVVRLVGACSDWPFRLVIVSSEVGQGLVPETPMGRQFRDLAGQAHQALGAVAEEVYGMVAGIPIMVKPTLQRIDLSMSPGEAWR